MEDIAENLIEIRGLEKRYSKDGDLILKGIDLDVKQGDFISIMGRSGCGKSTFLKTVGLMEKPTGGKMTIQGRDISKLWQSEIADVRRREMGFIFQQYNLMNSITIRENVMLPAILDKMDGETRSKRTDELIERFGLAKYKENYPRELSGGQQQRVALCRALINNPYMILGDEPTGNLDSKMSMEVINMLASLNKDDGKTIIIVTHDPKIAMKSNTVVFMKDGLLMNRIDKFGDEEQKNLTEEQVEDKFYRNILANIDNL